MLLHSGKTTVTHIHGCVVTTVYPTLPRFKSKMALVWDRSIDLDINRTASQDDNERGPPPVSASASASASRVASIWVTQDQSRLRVRSCKYAANSCKHIINSYRASTVV